MTKKIITVLSIFLFSFSQCFAQGTVSAQQLQTAHQEAQDALQKMKENGVDGLQLLEMVGGGLIVGSLAYAAGKGLSYLALKEEAKNYAALFAQQEKLGRSGAYLAKDLGKKNFRMLQKMLEDWKKGYIYEVPVVIVEPWQRSFYVVKPEHTKEFLKKTNRLWNEHLAQVQVKADSRMTALRGIRDFSWNAVAEFNEKLVLAMEEQGVLASDVDRFTSFSQARSFAAARKDLVAGTLKYKKPFSWKLFAKSAGKKIALVTALALLFQIGKGSDKEHILARVDQNPALLFQLTQKEAAALTQWPEMAHRYLAASALLQEIAQFPIDQQQALYQQVQKSKSAQQRRTYKSLEHQLKSVSLY